MKELIFITIFFFVYISLLNFFLIFFQEVEFITWGIQKDRMTNTNNNFFFFAKY